MVRKPLSLAGTLSRHPGASPVLRGLPSGTIHRPAFHRHCHPTTSQVLATSAQLPPDQRLVMYDACDGFAPQAPLGPLRKRLDSRRNTKPKKAAVQLQVCTPFNPAGFHFGKIRNESERLLRLRLAVRHTALEPQTSRVPGSQAGLPPTRASLDSHARASPWTGRRVPAADQHVPALPLAHAARRVRGGAPTPTPYPYPLPLPLTPTPNPTLTLTQP